MYVPYLTPFLHYNLMVSLVFATIIAGYFILSNSVCGSSQVKQEGQKPL